MSLAMAARSECACIGLHNGLKSGVHWLNLVQMKTFASIVFATCSLLCFAVAMPAFAQGNTTPSAASAGVAVKTVEINRAAKVVLVEGDVAVVSSAKQKRALIIGDYIVEGDSIVTGKDGELHLDMEDGGYISVRPNTKMRIVKYQAKGDADDSAVFRLLEGSLRSVTGWIGKFNPRNYLVHTPNATVGIRGTDHEPLVIPNGSSLGEPGTYDKVNEGGSFIHTPAGRADVAPNQAGFVGVDKNAKPRVLKEIPKYFRAGRFDQRFQGKHAEVLARIEKRREDRRTEIKQKLQNVKGVAQGARAEKQQANKDKREAAQKQREEARKAREAAKKEKEEKRKAALEATEAEKGEHAAKVPRKAHPLHK